MHDPEEDPSPDTDHSSGQSPPPSEFHEPTWRRWAVRIVVGIIVLCVLTVSVYALMHLRRSEESDNETTQQQQQQQQQQAATSGIPAGAPPGGATSYSASSQAPTIPPPPPVPNLVAADPEGEIKEWLADIQKLEDLGTPGYSTSETVHPQEGEVPVTLLDALMIDGFKKDLENEINQPTGNRGRIVDEIVRIRFRLSEDATRFEYAVFFYTASENGTPLTPEGRLAITTLRLRGDLWGTTESHAFAAKLRLKFRELFPDFNFGRKVRNATTGPLPDPVTIQGP